MKIALHVVPVSMSVLLTPFQKVKSILLILSCVPIVVLAPMFAPRRPFIPHNFKKSEYWIREIRFALGRPDFLFYGYHSIQYNIKIIPGNMVHDLEGKGNACFKSIHEQGKCTVVIATPSAESFASC